MFINKIQIPVLMDKIRIYLQYPWRFPDSPYYKYLVNYPSRGVEYLNIKNQRGAITKKRIFSLSTYLKRTRHYANKLRLPFPNAHKTKERNLDLVHCAHCLSKNKNTPWVADFESYWQFWLSGRKTEIGRKWVKKILLRRNCKKIIAWTKHVENDIINLFPEVRGKVEVVYPAVPPQKIKREKRATVNLIFIARYFYGKGGLHALEAIDRLTKLRKNVRGYIISTVPQEILKKYSENEKIKFIDIVPQEKLFKEIYPISDIFVYPGYSDTFGFSILEAMSFGLPVITVQGEAREEIVENWKTGVIIPSKYSYRDNIKGHNQEIIEGIIEACLKLIDNPNLIKKMRENCINQSTDGKFSIKERNKRLYKIYEEAIKN